MERERGSPFQNNFGATNGATNFGVNKTFSLNMVVCKAASGGCNQNPW